MPLVVALVVKEFQTWLRGRLTFAVFSALVMGTSLLVFLLSLLILAPDANAAPALFSTTSTTSANILVQQRPMFLFGAVALCLLLAAGVVAPAVAASAFAGERHAGTLDLLLLQGPGAARLVWGKVLAALIFSLLILSVGVPLFAPSWSFGGAQPHHIGILALLLATSTLFFSALGVFFGALLRAALPAALFAQGVALFLLFGTLGLHLGVLLIGGSDLFKPLLWLNPFLALLSGGGPVTDQFARQAPIAYRGVISLPLTHWVPGLPLPAWAIASSLWTLLSIVLVLAASVVIDPCHPLKTLRRKPA